MFRLLKSIFSLFGKRDNASRILKNLKKIENTVGFKINNPQYFVKAFTHSSVVDVNSEFHKSNERLEFLGDAVLGLAAAEYLFNNFPDEDEGFLSKSRSQLVNKSALLFAAKNLNLIEYIAYDKRFLSHSEKGIETILANSFEALIGAIYLDQGLGHSKEFIMKKLIIPSTKNGILQSDQNHKGILLESTHKMKVMPPVYKLVSSEGPEHNKTFIIDVYIDEEFYGRGEGKSKKTAEQAAAKTALEKLIKT